MKEVVDRATGAILFKRDQESDTLCKKIDRLENKVSELSSEINHLKNLIADLINRCH